MLKNQQHFVSMEAQVDLGTALMERLDASLESYNQAVGWVASLEVGDNAALEAIVAQHGEHLPEIASMEAVQVHINSSQVEAVIEFLKKWIPKLIKKIGELLSDFFDWIKMKARQLGVSIDNTIQQVRLSVKPSYKWRPETDVQKAAVTLMQEDKFRELTDVESLRSLVTGLDSALRSATAGQPLGQIKLRSLVDNASVWLTGEIKHESFATAGMSANDNTAPWNAVYELPVPAASGRELIQGLGSRAPEELELPKKEVLDRLESIKKAQMQVISSVTQCERELKGLRSRVAEMSKMNGLHSAEEAKALVSMTNFVISASQNGLQTRLRVLGQGLTLIKSEG